MIRQARNSDVKAINHLRLQVRENMLSDPSVVTEQMTLEAITQTGRGWVFEENGIILGFSIALHEDPTIWALFVHPDAEGRGIGHLLHEAAVDWLWSLGAKRIWLGTDPGTRAERFYRDRGWIEAGRRSNGEIRFELPRPENRQRTRLSVVMVSDFEPAKTKSWKDEQLLLESLARQDIQEDFELILVESMAHRDDAVPERFYELFPKLKLVYFDSGQSAALKDYGVKQSAGEYVAVIESDCRPSPNWLRLLLEAVREGSWSVSGALCIYGEETAYQRVMSLLDRSWRDPGQSGESRYISNNGAIFRRQVLEEFPYPDAVTPFLSAQQRNTCIVQSGYRSYFERRATMVHALGGWGFAWDLHRNKGHQLMVSSDKQGFWMIPALLLRKIRSDLRNCRRVGHQYLRWYDWPLYALAMFVTLLPKTVGMADALARVEQIPDTAYR